MAKKKKHIRIQEDTRLSPEPGRLMFAPGTPLRILIVVQILLLAWRFSPALCTNGDNARYYILGESLARGSGYRDISHPGEPVETLFPIGFPLLLAAIHLVSDTPLLPKIVFSFCGVLVILLCYHFFKPYLGFLLAPLLVLVALSGFVVEYSVILMSEIPYLTASLAALVLLKKSIDHPESKVLFSSALLCSLLPVYFRSAGVAFCAAWVVTTVWNRQYRHAVGHIVLYIVFTIVYRSLTSWDNPYIVSLFQRNSYDPEMGYVTAKEMLDRILANTEKISGLILQTTLVPLPNTVPVFIRGLASKILMAFMCIGWLKLLFSPLRFISVYVFFSFGIVLMWQTQWVSERFMIPIIPFLYLFVLAGLHAAVALFDPRHQRDFRNFIRQFSSLKLSESLPAGGRRFIIACIVLMLLPNLYYSWANRAANTTQGPDWRNYYSCANWIRLNTHRNAVVACRKPTLFYVVAKRKALAYEFSHNVDKIIESMEREGVTHVVFDNFLWTQTTARYLVPTLNSHPDRFKPVYGIKGPDTFVMEFVRK